MWTKWEDLVSVQTAGCMQMGCTAGMGHDTHTTDRHCTHYLLLDSSTTRSTAEEHVKALLGGARAAWTVTTSLPLWHGGLTMLPLPTQSREHLLLAHTLVVCYPLVSFRECSHVVFTRSLLVLKLNALVCFDLCG